MSENPNVASPAPSPPDVASPAHHLSRLALRRPRPARRAPTGQCWTRPRQHLQPPPRRQPRRHLPPRESSMAAPRGLSYAVDIVFCIDVTGSMTPIIDEVKANALRLLRRRAVQPDRQGQERRPAARARHRLPRLRRGRRRRAGGVAVLHPPRRARGFSDFVNGLIAEGGGDAPESGLEAVALAINSPWTTTGDRRRQVIVVWTDQPAHPLERR